MDIVLKIKITGKWKCENRLSKKMVKFEALTARSFRGLITLSKTYDYSIVDVENGVFDGYEFTALATSYNFNGYRRTSRSTIIGHISNDTLYLQLGLVNRLNPARVKEWVLTPW